MHVFVAIQHPAHVHFFRHAISELEAEGHRVDVFVRDKEVIRDLLDAHGVEHTVLADAAAASSLPTLAATQIRYEARLLREARKRDPDVMVEIGGTAVAHVSKLVDARSVVFTDTEHATLSNAVTFPFADAVWTPECFTEDVGGKQVRYPGYHELAYLHPDRFDPDPTVLEAAGVGPDESFVVFRLVSWNASHDVGAGGVDDAADVVRRIEETGTTVLVTAEGDLPPALADRQVSVAPERMHDLLAHADLFVGEGATMAAESAVLGTPALYVNTLRMGYTDELEAEYGLLENFNGDERHRRAVERAVEILGGDGPAAAEWAARRRRLLAEKRDTTEFVRAAIAGASGVPSEEPETGLEPGASVP